KQYLVRPNPEPFGCSVNFGGQLLGRGCGQLVEDRGGTFGNVVVDHPQRGHCRFADRVCRVVGLISSIRSHHAANRTPLSQKREMPPKTVTLVSITANSSDSQWLLPKPGMWVYRG